MLKVSAAVLLMLLLLLEEKLLEAKLLNQLPNAVIHHVRHLLLLTIWQTVGVLVSGRAPIAAAAAATAADNSICSQSCGKFYDIVWTWRLNWKIAACCMLPVGGKWMSWAELAIDMNRRVGICPGTARGSSWKTNFCDLYSLNSLNEPSESFR